MKKIMKNIKENISYIFVLLSTFLALVLIVAFTFGFFYANAKKDTISIGNMAVTSEAQRVDDSLAVGINTLQVTTYTVEHMIDNNASANELQEYLVSQSKDIKERIDPQYKSVYGVLADNTDRGLYKGTYIDGDNWTPPADYNPYLRPWYINAFEKAGKTTIVSPYIDAQTNEMIISFSQLLDDGKSVISLDKNIIDIYEAAEDIHLNGNGYCFVYDHSGYIVAHYDDNEKGKNYLTDPDVESSDMKTLVEKVNKANGEIVEMRINGEKSIVFSRNVQDEWYVVLVVSERDVFKDCRNTLFINLGLSLIIFILVGYFCTSNYINRKKAIKYAEEIRIDTLTGLNNRGEFDRYLNDITNTIDEKKSIYLIMFDADNFKQINDKHGHPEGDRAIKYIAEAIRKTCEEYKCLGFRYGGDEFAIICSCIDEEHTIKIAENIIDNIKQISLNAKITYNLSVSYGIAKYDDYINSVSELIDNADNELYIEKARKKGIIK